METFGEWLRKTRENRGFGLNQFAHKAGCSPAELSRIETGERQNPSPAIVKAIAEALGVPVEQLYTKLGYLDVKEKDDFWVRETSPTDIELEELLRSSNPNFIGTPLSNEDIEDILVFLRTKWEMEKRKREKGGNSQSPHN